MKPSSLNENNPVENEGAAVPRVGDKRLSQQSRVISAQFQQILDSLPFTVMIVDAKHKIQFANSAVRQAVGLTLAQLQGRYCPKMIHGLDGPYQGCPVEQAIAGGATEKEHFAAEQGRWLLTTAYPTGAKSKEGLDLYFHTVRDITDQKNAQEALRASEENYHRLFEELEDAIFVVTAGGRLKDLNRAGRELFGVGKQDSMTAFSLFRDLKLLDCGWGPFVAALKENGRVADYEISFKGRRGRTTIASINATMERDKASGEGVIRGIARDLTRNRELEQRTISDELTGLYNRAFFDACLADKVMHTSGKSTAALSVLFVDIDDFKAYNDSYGHPEGDYILRRVAQAMITPLRDDDVVARYGGDEFAVIVVSESQAAARVAERMRASVESSCSPRSDQRIIKTVTVSVGVATLGVDATSADDLIKVADQRMYDAKRLAKEGIGG
jgi:diguanylate cyclase (GGDEF)-like protein/PAS domain S-box-containing protein